MKKNIVILMLFMATTMLGACAESIKVRALDKISTKNPTMDIGVKLVEDVTINNIELSKGYILKGDMVDVVPPKRPQKNASFSYKVKYYTDLEGKKHEVENLTLKYRQQMRPNFRRSSFSLLGSDGGGITFSPYDIDIIKESTSPVDFLKRELIKDSPLDVGWEIELKPNNIFYFKMPEEI